MSNQAKDGPGTAAMGRPSTHKRSRPPVAQWAIQPRHRPSGHEPLSGTATMTGMWESAEDRAKQVAHSYRRLAQRIADGDTDDPSIALEALDEHWSSHGAGWVRPSQQPLDLDAWCTAGELAELLGIDPQRLRDWARRGHIRSGRFGVAMVRCYCVGDVVAYQRRRRMGTPKAVGALS